ncbi:hypothetical protein ACFL6S_30285 [Candidatus Poribacteria bacterium]
MIQKSPEAVANIIDGVLGVCHRLLRQGQLTASQVQDLEEIIQELERVRSPERDQQLITPTRLYGAVAWLKIVGRLAEIMIDFFKDKI